MVRQGSKHPGQLLTPPASAHANSDAHGCSAGAWVVLGNPIPQRNQAAPGQQLSNQTLAERAPLWRWDYREEAGTTELLSLLLLGNKSE